MLGRALPGPETDFIFEGRESRLYWPFLSGLGIGANLVFMGLVSRGGYPVLGSMLVLLGLLVGGFYSLLARVFAWSSMYCRGDFLVLESGKLSFPGGRWLAAAAFPPLRSGQVEIPLGSIRLEWQGNKLLLHGHPAGDLRIARGAAAMRALDWLVRQGIPDPGAPGRASGWNPARRG